MPKPKILACITDFFFLTSQSSRRALGCLKPTFLLKKSHCDFLGVCQGRANVRVFLKPYNRVGSYSSLLKNDPSSMTFNRLPSYRDVSVAKGVGNFVFFAGACGRAGRNGLSLDHQRKHCRVHENKDSIIPGTTSDCGTTDGQRGSGCHPLPFLNIQDSFIVSYI